MTLTQYLTTIYSAFRQANPDADLADWTIDAKEVIPSATLATGWRATLPAFSDVLKSVDKADATAILEAVQTVAATDAFFLAGITSWQAGQSLPITPDIAEGLLAAAQTLDEATQAVALGLLRTEPMPTVETVNAAKVEVVRRVEADAANAANTTALIRANAINALYASGEDVALVTLPVVDAPAGYVFGEDGALTKDA